jgi:ferredoxin
MPEDHTNSINLQNPLTPGVPEFGLPDFYPIDTVPFGSSLVTCYAVDQMNPYSLGTYENPLPDVLFTMLVAKSHGWIGGFSSILVMAIGLVFFLICRGYIKWRITLAYLVTTALFSAVMGFVYGGDLIMRVLFHLFMGSSIFLAFFMATDPATTPLTRKGQLIFGIGLAILTILIQTYTGFLGGSILALVIMNLTCPLLDRVGVPKARKERIACAVLPKGKKLGEVATTKCIRCGMCLYVCSSRLPTVSIKEAAEKGDWTRVKNLGVEYCQQCGTCSFVCPARIDLKGAMRAAKEKVTKQ